jgi:hypothetical protein
MQSTCSSSAYPPFQEVPPPPAPPYNATNFNSENGPVYSTLQYYAHNSPNYPLPQDSNQDMIQRNRANIAYFVNMNNQTQYIKTLNATPARAPYPQFRSEAEKIMYIQGMAMTAARNKFTGDNPSYPAGVPCSTIYGIINATVTPPG